jgi:hypothetical protein
MVVAMFEADLNMPQVSAVAEKIGGWIRTAKGILLPSVSKVEPTITK